MKYNYIVDIYEKPLTKEKFVGKGEILTIRTTQRATHDSRLLYCEVKFEDGDVSDWWVLRKGVEKEDK